MTNAPAIVLLSGGLDSVTALAWALHHAYHLRAAISFTYGQRHVREIDAASAIANYYQIPHEVVALPPIAGSGLTDLGSIPQGRNLSALSEEIAPTYVPNRNMILLACAAARALCSDATYLVGGWNSADAVNYPDCRDEFLVAAQQTLQLATLRPFKIVRPLINDRKAAIVRRALDLNAPIEYTWTCYLGGDRACGTCDACQLRIDAFREVKVVDPIPYAVPIDWLGCEPYSGLGI